MVAATISVVDVPIAIAKGPATAMPMGASAYEPKASYATTLE